MPTPQFFAMITAQGLAELAYAIAHASMVSFTQIVVGDGGGSYHQPGGDITHFADNGTGGTRVTASGHDLVNGEIVDISGTVHYDSLPSHFTVFNCNIGAGTFDIPLPFTSDDAVGQWNRIALVHQVWPITGSGGPINAVYVHPDHANWIVIEGYIPATVGGFTVREVAVISPGIAGNVLFAVGKVPESLKPVLSSGSGKDLYFRIILVTSATANITMVVDPNVILASQSYVQLFAKWATETERLITGVAFEPSVVQGDAVYFNPATSQFGQAIANGTAKQNTVGFADVNHCCVIRGGYFPWRDSSLTQGSVYYLSTTTLGGIQTTPPTRYTVVMGIALASNVMDVAVDDILSAYEDRAMTFDSSGNVGFLANISAQNINAASNIIAGALMQAPNVNVLNQLGVGSLGGFPAFLVNNEGDIYVNGGADGNWYLFFEGTPLIRILSDFHINLYDISIPVFREMKQAQWSNAIVCAKSDGKIDPSFLPPVSLGDFPNTYIAPWGGLFPDSIATPDYNATIDYSFNVWTDVVHIDPDTSAVTNLGFIVEPLINHSVWTFPYTFSLGPYIMGLQFRLLCTDVEHGGAQTVSDVFTMPGEGPYQVTLSVSLPISKHLRIAVQCHNNGTAGYTYGFRKDVTPSRNVISWGYSYP